MTIQEKTQKELDRFNELIQSLKVNSSYSEDVIHSSQRKPASSKR